MEEITSSSAKVVGAYIHTEGSPFPIYIQAENETVIIPEIFTRKPFRISFVYEGQEPSSSVLIRHNG